ncbi:MAG TPA: amino acid adenylation domain-containing protein [Pyrinomonadaceae bacterium]
MKTENVEDLYKLTPMQQGMLFHSLYGTESDVYFRQLSCSMSGELNTAAFAQAWRQAVNRHSILRTSFHWENLETPVQVVHRNVELPLEYHDWRGLSTDEQQKRLEQFFLTDEETKFNLSKAPLMRLGLIRLAEDEHRFILSNHHLLLDGWSRAHLLKEVFALYEGLCRNQPAQLERPRPYREYVRWLKQQDLSQAETFWQEMLKGFTHPTPLVAERPATGAGKQAHDPCEEAVRLSEASTNAVQAFATRHQLTLNTLIQGAWSLLLSRYSGEQDVVFGAVVSGRPASLNGVETIVGLFINTLPVRVRLSPSDTLLPWLKNLQFQQAEMREFEHSPLVQVQGWSEVARSLPLFESLLVVDNYPADASMRRQAGNLVIGNLRGVESNNYPVAVAVIPGTELLLRMPYDRNRFEPETITRMLGHLRTLLEGMVSNPAQRLADVPMLTGDERRQLLGDWSSQPQQPDAPEARCLHELFEAQVERTPEAIAVSLEDERLTYRELNGRANQLAHHLRSLGVAPEVRVSVFVERSIHAVVALLGILKAGGVYLPLDPAYPAERLEMLLEDADTPVILTQDELVSSLPFYAAASDIVCLDSDGETLARESAENLSSGVSPENLAYIIYTSGSTGTPKGVCLSHAAATSHCAAIQQEFRVEASDKVLQFASFNFDVSLEQILSTLLGGAQLVLRGTELWTTSEFRDKLRDEALTIINPPTAYWHRLAQESADGTVQLPDTHLKLVIAGGDAMLPEAVRLWQQTPLKEVRLLNAYGPTEAAITSLIFEVPGGYCADAPGRRIPIGRPVQGRAIYILDRQGDLVPAAVPGELHIGGNLLARNYLNRPELTAEKFIPDAFSDTPGARLYRTGDLARYLPDGNVEFLGRIDYQVKIRGFRIELGEIEAAINRHEAIREAVVWTWEDSQGEKRLVAYVVANRQPAPSAVELRAFLEQKLPEYFVPAYYVFLDELPLTSTGKVDRRALPAPQAVKIERDVAEAVALSPTEELLIGIWADILGVERIGIYDDFFELGGHSLLATQLISRLREVFQLEFPLRTIFEQPTISALAASIETSKQIENGSQLTPILPVSREQALPLSFAQQRLWFAERMEPGTAAFNRPHAVRLNGKLNVEALEQSFNEVISRHEVLRTTFAETEQGAAQIISPERTLKLPVMDLRHVSPKAEREKQALEAATEESVRPFDLTAGPLFRATLLRLDEEEHILAFTLHHIVTDGWSEGVLINEIVRLYEAFLNRQPSPLSPLPIQYADFAHWQREWLQGERLESQIDYWKRQLANLPELRLGDENRRPLQQTRRGATQTLTLSRQVTQALKNISRREGTTLFMTLLAAFKTLLHRLAGQEDIVVGTGIANRNRAETEGLIGFFVNQLVLRTDLSGNPNFRELLARVREVTLGAYAHQNLPFEKVVEVLRPERRLDRAPLFQTVFVMQNAPSATLELPGLTLNPLRIEKGTAHVDLTLSITETEQGLFAAMEYNTDLFSDRYITLMLKHFEALASGIAVHPEDRLLDFPLGADEQAAPSDGDSDSLPAYQNDEFAFDLVAN